jgi:pyruvate/2-oxoglutarate dehydrogenase complex dihydrolipoamide dehydrogenase (E3) component
VRSAACGKLGFLGLELDEVANAQVSADEDVATLAKMPMTEVLRTTTVSEPQGFLKMLIGTSSDEILGFTAFVFEASELLAAVQTAMIGRLPYTLLRDAIFTHPTVSEGLIGLLGRVDERKVY